ncbi:DNA-binding response OmpR family regulator [Demequina lutea]|uniref:DNA-binding response OmpR family regulator n=1 Tax=Demequina lutea TaxID=431489 RepID=A0A7Z0CGS8_9MICO|nr:DNA-binding response OmpR family regulator [Demequina lutea]
MSARSILVVDDEANIRQLLTDYLHRDGFDVEEAVSGEQALDALARRVPDLIILDVRLPGIDGFETLRRIRKTSDVYVLMLTARSEESDTLIGLEVGADDYVSKPFSPREVVARVRTLLRRRGGIAPADDRREFVGLSLDTTRHEIFADGATVMLTALEFDLLDALTSAPGRVFTRRQLIERVWGWDFYGDERIVDVHIRKLRSAIFDAADDPRFIATVRGVGYKFIGVQQ